MEDEVNPYIVVKGLPGSNNTINYSIIVFLNYLKKYQDNVLTRRYYNYMQLDYYTNNDSTVYYHNFIHNEEDGGHYSNAFNVAPRYNTSELLTNVSLNLKYEYELEEKVEKEIKFSENILAFDENKFSDIITKAVDEDNRYHFDIIVTKNEDEDYYRYKVVINLDDNNLSGHYDIQTWVKCNERLIPFIGYYHYRAINGNVNSVSDEKIEANEKVSEIYYMVRFYDGDGNITETCYQKKVD